jgi:hypothetical protein
MIPLSYKKSNNNLLASQIKYIKDKYHFFIGNYTKDFKMIGILNELKKNLKKKYGIKDNSYSNYHICFKFLYIGYMTNEEAYYYMNNIISILLISLAKNIRKLVCSFTKFKVDHVKDYLRVSLEYKDEDDIISNIIIPYIHKYGLLPIYNKKSIDIKPKIELLYTKASMKLKDTSAEINMRIPQETFDMNSISLIRGTVIKTRSGTPSQHDNMNFEEVKNYKYDLQ